MNVTSINCQACFGSLNLEKTKHGICKCEYCGTSHNLDSEIKIKVNLNDYMFAVKLVHFMTNHMNIADLQDLTYSISGDERLNCRFGWDDFRHTSLNCAARELTGWLKRRGYLDILVDHVCRVRPMFYVEML